MFRTLLTFSFCFACSFHACAQATDVVFQERDGLVAVEAEHFAKQSQTKVRKFHVVSPKTIPDVSPDGDPPHLQGASGGAYLEILPDTRRTHGDKLIRGGNFSPQPGQMAVLDYRVHFTTPGRYYVWVRAYSTGTEDNGLHVGLNGTWPESGQRLQWCEGKRSWRWESRQRTNEQHCGEPGKIFLDIKEPGVHTISFSMREDGFEFDKWMMTTDRDFQRPGDAGPEPVAHKGIIPKPFVVPARFAVAEADAAPLVQPRESDGDGTLQISGETKLWHNVTLTLDGPFAHELDQSPNPFIDRRFEVEFVHESGKSSLVPGYFAADGNAANSSAVSGHAWRVHFAPDLLGRWTYTTRFTTGPQAALAIEPSGSPLEPYHGITGEFRISPTDKSRPDFRAEGRLQYVGKHYLQFAGSQRYLLKAGADAPETLLGYADFDNTIAGKPDKVPLKTYAPHLQDWNPGDPVWKDGQGKGLIGAVNFLSSKGCNAFSFLTYNAGGDGDNVWPFVARNDKLHYDCSKLDQWGIVFEHGTHKGMYLHFKMQETENDDHRRGKGEGHVPESLDGGVLGVERKLYCRELIARFGHNLALNWNLGEENTQSTAEQKAMLDYIAALDPYGHNRVLHTFPNEQEKKYRPLAGDQSQLTGLSLQNGHIKDTHWQTVKWVRESASAGKPWIVAFDESGSAAHGQCPDLGYKGYDGRDRTGKMTYTEHDVRHQTLWGTLLGGGAGVEYYFGYQYVENDLVCEDWRSRDRSWDYCRIALEFFHTNEIPFWEMSNQDQLVGNPEHDNSRYCFAKTGEVYVVYLPPGQSTPLDLSETEGEFLVHWFNPRAGGELQQGSVTAVNAAAKVALGDPPAAPDQDWVVLVRRKR